ncbi:MAG: hypothetical protein COA38_15830 [Fluviicola sp.]|nr:MAG: hypothetical protein COA38_15830 [Fluviicola sp.]
MSAINIVKAAYASENNGFDVTAKCQELVNNGNDDIPVNNNTFGDPDPGHAKYFTILYVTDKRTVGHAKGCGEGTSLDLV